ncbi:2-hydroxyacyl-CoA lyase [Morus notabilis]|uniref:2-hydroxyacyl-CoA lyase n=1 Tax=Morus notabilis TaxID=981085 RepID=W9S114_9ROSA|nr:2-hydroxyacyl-CoA lyase [Morus notabilis]
MVSQFGAHTYSAGPRPDNEQSTKFKGLHTPIGLRHPKTPSLMLPPLCRIFLMALSSEHHSSSKLHEKQFYNHERAVSLLRMAERPLIVFGKGAAFARAEGELKKLVERTGIPFLPTPMGKGLLPDTHELAATAARSLAIGKCEVALVVGARLNWLLHFGDPPKWSKDVKFILVDVSEEEIELRKPELGIVGA